GDDLRVGGVRGSQHPAVGVAAAADGLLYTMAFGTAARLRLDETAAPGPALLMPTRVDVRRGSGSRVRVPFRNVGTAPLHVDGASIERTHVLDAFDLAPGEARAFDV